MNNNIIDSVLHVVGCELDPKELELKDGKSIAELLNGQQEKTEQTQTENQPNNSN